MTTPTASTPNRAGFALFYTRIALLADKFQSVLLLLIRIYIGYQCAISGYAHITHFHDMVENFRGWHVPIPQASVIISALTEMVGGSLLLLGFGTRLVSLALIGNFVVAILAPNLSDEKYRPLLLHFWDHQDVILKDDAFPFLAAAVLIFVFGPGWFSIDGIIRFVRQKK